MQGALAGGQGLPQQHSCWLSPVKKQLTGGVAAQLPCQVMHACYGSEGTCECALAAARHQALVRLQLW